MSARHDAYIEIIILVEAARAGLQVKRGKSWKVAIVKLHAADMEGMAGILATEISACVGIRDEFQFKSTARKAPTRC